MDNGILVFIIMALGVVVVWQTSKLKQYERFEKMMPGQRAERATPGATDQASDQTSGAVSGQASDGEADATDSLVPARTVAELADEQSAVHRVTGEGASASRSPGSAAADDNVEEAKRVQLVMARCRYAEFYVDQLDDDYERDQFSGIVDECVEIARRIDDPFLQATALQPLILLMQQAGWDARQDSLLREVRDDLVRQRIEASLAKAATEEA